MEEATSVGLSMVLIAGDKWASVEQHEVSDFDQLVEMFRGFVLTLKPCLSFCVDSWFCQNYIGYNSCLHDQFLIALCCFSYKCDRFD